MRRVIARLPRQIARMVSLILLAALGTVWLTRSAPGYFSDVRETDPRYAEAARAEMESAREQQGSIARLTGRLLLGWLHGDMGRSRQYDVPVASLLGERLVVSAKLLFGGVLLGWLVALTAALPLSARRGSAGEVLIAAPAAVLLAIPTGAMAILCLMLDTGGPLLVLATLVGVRDFKLVYALLRQTWTNPCLLYARAQGIGSGRMTLVHLLPGIAPHLVALATMSVVVGLSAIVPVEVIFNVPGIGQLAWSAAMNRDLPVLLAVTLLMALAVGAMSIFGEQMTLVEAV
jgi:peptide/nickel transport system permease protein